MPMTEVCVGQLPAQRFRCTGSCPTQTSVNVACDSSTFSWLKCARYSCVIIIIIIISASASSAGAAAEMAASRKQAK